MLFLINQYNLFSNLITMNCRCPWEVPWSKWCITRENYCVQRWCGGWTAAGCTWTWNTTDDWLFQESRWYWIQVDHSCNSRAKRHRNAKCLSSHNCNLSCKILLERHTIYISNVLFKSPCQLFKGVLPLSNVNIVKKVALLVPLWYNSWQILWNLYQRFI